VFSEDEIQDLAEAILKAIEKEPLRFYDILRMFEREEYRKILLAWSRIMEKRRVVQDEFGRWHRKDEK
jgi:hypothetical protein